MGWIGWGARKTVFKLFLLSPGFLPLPGLPPKHFAASFCGVVDSRCGVVYHVIDFLHGRVGFLTAFAGACKLTEHHALRFFPQCPMFCLRLLPLFFRVYVLVFWLERFLYSNVRNGYPLLIASQLGTNSFRLKSVPTWDGFKTRSQITRKRRVFGRVQVKIDRSSRPG